MDFIKNNMNMYIYICIYEYGFAGVLHGGPTFLDICWLLGFYLFWGRLVWVSMAQT
jgi:hypothetical protein